MFSPPIHWHDIVLHKDGQAGIEMCTHILAMCTRAAGHVSLPSVEFHHSLNYDVLI